MSLIDISFLAVGLAMDAFAVSIISGLTVRSPRLRDAFRIAIFFGLFQAVMPWLGWGIGLGLRDVISSIDHWIAFGLLSMIGIKLMSRSGKAKSKPKMPDPLRIYTLLLLSLGTSIDALAVGVSLSFLDVSMVIPSLIIGGVTFSLSFAGVFIGHRFGPLLGGKAEIIGGIFLVGIGIKILIEHLY